MDKLQDDVVDVVWEFLGSSSVWMLVESHNYHVGRRAKVDFSAVDDDALALKALCQNLGCIRWLRVEDYDDERCGKDWKRFWESLNENESIEEIEMVNLCKMRQKDDDSGGGSEKPLIYSPGLKRLSLGKNFLRHEYLSGLFRKFSENMVQLLELNLEGTGLEVESITALVEYLKVENCILKRLNLDRNPLIGERGTLILEALTSSKSMTWLSVRNTMLSSQHGTALGNLLKENQSLEYLNVGSNDLCGGGVAMAEGLKHNRVLKVLYLVCHQFEEDEGVSLGNALESNTTLESLWVTGCNFGVRTARAFSKALGSSNSGLKLLNASCNQFGNDGARILFESLRENKSLEDLILVGSGAGDEAGFVLADVLHVNSTLKRLTLSESEINASATAIINAWGKFSREKCILEDNQISSLKEITEYNIQKLYLCQNLLDEASCKTIESLLAKSRTIEKLYMTETGASGEHIGLGLARNTSLKRLRLGYNLLGEIGACCIGTALAHHKFLQELELEQVGLCEQSGLMIARALAENKSLEVLRMGFNDLGDQTACELAISLATNKSLTELDLSNNLVGSEGAKALANALARSNSTLKEIHFSSNLITSDSGPALAMMLEKNSNLQNVYLEGNLLDSCHELFTAMSTNNSSHLRMLDLSETGITPTANLRGVFERPMSKLISLDLSNNELKDEHGVLIFDALKSETARVYRLFVSNNEFGKETIRAMREALKVNRRLRELSLSHNYILNEVDCAVILGKMIAENTSMRKLWLYGIEIPSRASSWLAKAILDNETLSSLSISFFEFTETIQLAWALSGRDPDHLATRDT